MFLNKQQTEDLEEAAKPLMAFLKKHVHPHCCVLVDSESANIMESLATVRPGTAEPQCPKASNHDTSGD